MQSHIIPQPEYCHDVKCGAHLLVESTGDMEVAKHNVFAQRTVGYKTLLEMSLHNERAFANRMSPSGRQEKVFIQYYG